MMYEGSVGLLSCIVFLPLLGAFLALAFPKQSTAGVRGFACGVTLLGFVLSCVLWSQFDVSQTGMQFSEDIPWITSLGIGYRLGVDGISLLLVVLTSFLAPLVVLSTYSGVTERVREYMVCLLFLQTGMLGAFLATDVFLFYVFWEVMLIPMYFLIGMWGGKRRIYAATKFFIYTMVGSLLMLVAIVGVVLAVKNQGGITFGWAEIASRLASVSLGAKEVWFFLAFALAFAIKVPMFPFHTWLPDAHVEAPTGGSVVLAGVLLKLGTFGFLRYAFWFFPKAAAAFLPTLGVLAVIGIVYGALVAMIQTDLKRLVAYSSVSHLGFVMLGLAGMSVTGVTGGVLQMVNHGISTGALFLLVGVVYERRHTRELADFGGLAKVMPVYAVLFVMAALSSIGLPGMNGFVGEFMILAGTFTTAAPALVQSNQSFAWFGIVSLAVVGGLWVLWFARAWLRSGAGSRSPVWFKYGLIGAMALLTALCVYPPMGACPGGVLVRPLLAFEGDTSDFREIFALLSVVAGTGVIFAAVYMLLATQKVFFGPVKHPENAHLSDLSAREGWILGVLMAVAVWMGVHPQPFIDVVDPTVKQYVQQFRERAGMPALKDVPVVRMNTMNEGGVR